MNNVRLPALIREFLEQQAIANPRYEQPRPPKPYTELVKPTWLIWGAVAIIVFQLTVIVSLGAPLRGSLRDRLSNWYVVALSLLMIALGAIGGWWWLKSVYKQAHKKRLLQSDVYQFKYKYSYRQYSKAEKLLERQQHRKLHKLLSGKCPKLISQSTITPEEKKLKVFLKKKFPFLQVKHRVKCLIKGECIEVEWVIISERTQVVLGVFFEDHDQDYYLKLLADNSERERLLSENWCIIEVTSTESLISIIQHLIESTRLL